MPFMALVTIRIGFICVLTVKEREFLGLMAPITQIRNRLLEQVRISAPMGFVTKGAHPYGHRSMDPPLRFLEVGMALVTQIRNLVDQLDLSGKTLRFKLTMTLDTVSLGLVNGPNYLGWGVGIRGCIGIGPICLKRNFSLTP